MTKELNPEIYERLEGLCAEGNKYAEERKFDEALLKFEEALKLIPEPRENWEASSWVFAAIGDMYFLKFNYQRALWAFNDAMRCGGIGLPFLHLRLGQIQFELGNEQKAGDELTRAFMGGGSDIFKGENPKYFEFIKRILKEPPEGWG